MASASVATVFEKTYTRTTGKPRPVVDTFAVANPATDFTLVVQNGQEDGAQRVTSAVILLNEQLIVGPWEFNPQVEVIRKPVSLQAQNTLSVEVRGKPGSLIKVSIVGGPLNLPPVANAGADQTSRVGDQVTLDGSDSSDADGDSLTYRWAFASRPTGSTATLSDPTAVQPSFTVDRPGSYTVELIVNDGEVDSAPDTVTISTINSAPVAKAGIDQSFVVGTLVTLDGSGSTDADGDLLTYRWTLDTRPLNSAATLANPTTPTPSLTIDKAGTYIIALVVNDGTVDSIPDHVAVTTLNSKPVANAGLDQQAEVDQTVTLDGSGSRDADNDPLAYSWSLIHRPLGSTAALNLLDQVWTTLTPDRAGDYVAQLIVNDGTVASGPDTVLIEVAAVNHPPVFTSTPVTTATVGQLYSYDADATDPDADDTLTFSLPTAPAGMTIDAASGLIAWTPTLGQGGAHPVTVRVQDAGGLSALQNFTVTVTVPPANHAPTITSTPVATATVGAPYSYDVDATDPDAGDTLTFALTTAPAGMTIDAATGLIPIPFNGT